VVALGTRQTLYEDRVEYVKDGGALVRKAFSGLLRRVLARTFQERHCIVRVRFSHGSLIEA
jgi:hypothetical protein